ncbi:MAG TPA: hypothetical protein ENJ65_04975 [Candidatus Tenderia electrophaga]|uniref:Uncharacterized protein n=1 Tax=Candidatus Tenderia electrophaga TaxID=1748243 RepID=A0A832J9I3_9GAMM|nr:hypothetical protein [Candidatus Tenderia electrophaga]
MTLSALIHKGGLARAATATPATTATHEANKQVTVAPVATVTVAKGTEQTSALLPIEDKKIRLWLVHIGETDSGVITELLSSCSDDMDTRRYFLQRSEEVPKPVIRNEPITCGDCTHFKRIEHPHIGHCAKGEPEAIAGLWDSDRRHCKYYLATPTTES